MKDSNLVSDTPPLMESQPFAKSILDALTAHISILDEFGNIQYVNAGWRDFADANQLNDPNYGVGVNYLDICDLAAGDGSQGAKDIAAGIRLVISRELKTFSFDYPCHGPAERRWFNIQVRPFKSQEDLGLILLHENVSARKQLEETLVERELKYHALFEGTADAIFLMRGDRFVDCNPSTLEMFACTRDKIIHQTPYQFSPTHQPNGILSKEDFSKYIQSALTHQPQHFEWTFIKANGISFEAEVRLTRIDLRGESHLMASFVDISERKQAERDLIEAYELLESRVAEIEKFQDQLLEQAIRDPLTGLFNRRYLEENLAQAIARADRYKYPISLVMIDIDHFKVVNDTYGHKAGDEMLVALSNLLRSQIRKGDTICRYGGEEFVVLMPRASWEAARQRANQWRKAFEALHVPYDGQTMNTTFSVGIATLSPEKNDIEDGMREADIALYRSKAEGRNRVTVSEHYRG